MDLDAAKMMELSHRIEKGKISEVRVLGKTFKIKDTKRKVLDKIYEIQFKVSFYKGKESPKGLLKRAKYVNSAQARICSLLLLNGWSYIPFVHAIHWRILRLRYTTETFAAIIEEGFNNNEVGFFLKNSVHLQKLLQTRAMMIKL